MSTTLFSPLKIRDLTLRNRIVLAPMLTYRAEGGYVNDQHLVHYGRFAIAGVGLILIESTKVDPRGCSTPRDLGLWKDDFIAPMRHLVQVLKAEGATVGIQLGHSGRKARQALPWEGRAQLTDVAGVDHGEPWELIAPSAVPQGEGWIVPREMTLAEIQETVEMYGQAARRADEAGFDVLEIHGAHGYLLHQFLSPAANQRTDAYGGSFENRIRLALEVVRRVRQSWPQGKPLFYRVSAVDEAGWSIEETVELSRQLAANGVDVVDCSSGGIGPTATRDSLTDPLKPTYGYQVPHAARVRRDTGVKTMAVGLIVHADQAESILAEGKADLVAIGRELLHNPNWALDAAEKLHIDKPHAVVPDWYGWWLEKRAARGFGGRPSTWQAGIDAPGG